MATYAAPISRHWHGHYSLFLTAAVFLVGIRASIGILQSLVQPYLHAIALALWLALSLLVLVWQTVGGWRACDNHAREGGGVVTGWVGYAALLLTVTLALFQLIDGVSNRIELQPAAMKDPVELKVSNENSVVWVDQPLDWPLFAAFKTLLLQHQTIKTVVLNSAGGRVFTARGMALLVEQYELDTHVDEYCYSACTIVYLAGNKRTLNSGAELGFHRYSMQEGHQAGSALQGQVQSIDIEKQLEKDKTYFINRGVSREFVNSIYQANSDSLWKPNRQMLIDAGVTTSAFP